MNTIFPRIVRRKIGNANGFGEEIPDCSANVVGSVGPRLIFTPSLIISSFILRKRFSATVLKARSTLRCDYTGSRFAVVERAVNSRTGIEVFWYAAWECRF